MDYFYQMGFWEMENPAVYGANHHLMVLSYYLQHPHLYSREGLQGAMQILVDFIEERVPPQEMRKRLQNQMDSGNRKFKISSRTDNSGQYKNLISWNMTAADVVAGGIQNFVENVKTWALSVYNSLKNSGNLPGSSSSKT